ncbi:DUF6527 family protein [Solilutibacter tolerans]|uniref:Uncharacterized protein n=1 Tax=Solilutibacter tolerans TaxID=1604334 RepID=A0A1N6S0A4_9GAMM|nr:DUF6527 family protein [Lysobacter tolerans]SIQ34477.1 hypothetical protein SAMN05421546_1145 [Lysobacter tolerans]
MKHDVLEPRFVKAVPCDLEPGVLYVSMQYGTVVHSCCCGCGFEVVTPLTPTDWRLTFDGESVSLWPSVGSWNLPCQSHYVIENNRVREALQWSTARIEAERTRDGQVKAKFYARQAAIEAIDAPVIAPVPPCPEVRPTGLLAKVRRWIF